MPSPTIERIHLTPDEQATKTLTPQTLQRAIKSLHTAGVVVLDNAIPPHLLENLNNRMIPEANHLHAQPNTHRNFGPQTGNIQQEPPREPNLIYPEVLTNAFATEIIECMLGPKPQLRFVSANTAFRPSSNNTNPNTNEFETDEEIIQRCRQPVHTDINATMTGFEHDLPAGAGPFGYCVNINLIDTDPTNGSTELWPGSHLESVTGTDLRETLTPDQERVRPELVEARRRVCPPVRLGLGRGAVVIRDFRLWHAGVPNLRVGEGEGEARIMLVVCFFARWWRSGLVVALPESLREKMGAGAGFWDERVDLRVRWVGDGEDYLRGAHDHDFGLLP